MKKLIKNKNKYPLRSILMSLGLSILLLVIFFVGILRIQSISRKQELELTKQAIHKSLIQCYAIEGIYPASLSYLEDNYYLTIDTDNYYVVYNSFSSNLMPEIDVFER